MANDLTLTNLAEDIFIAADKVGREALGLIPSVTMNASSTEASVGDTIKAAVTAESPAFVDIANGFMSVPEGTSQTITADTFQLTNAKAVQIPMGAEKELQLRNGGQYQTVYGDLIQQAMRKLTNQMEADLAIELKINAAYASGVAGTTPFAVGSGESGLEELAIARKVLLDSGCPMSDGELALVVNTSAGVNFRNNLNLLGANTSGTTDMRTQGTLIDLLGARVRESGGIALHTAGTAAGTGLIDAVDNIGSTSIVINSLDNGITILAGDVMSTATGLAGSATEDILPVVSASLTAGSSGSGANALTAVLNRGLKRATANDEAPTFADYNPSFLFHRNAVELAMRAPATPAGGDAADDALIVQDPHSGMVFEVRIYKGYRKTMIEVAAVWGVKAWKSDFIHTIMG